MSCAGLTDSYYDFMKSRKGLDFRWFCGALVALIVPWGVIVQRVRWMKSYPTFLLQWRESTEDWEIWRLETGSTGDSGPVSFADVVRRTISEVRGSKEPDMRVRDHGRTRVIKNEEVLVLKPRCPEGASATPSSVSVDGLTNVLKSIPVKNCRATSRGSVVVKFPHG